MKTTKYESNFKNDLMKHINILYRNSFNLENFKMSLSIDKMQLTTLREINHFYINNVHILMNNVHIYFKSKF